MSIINTIKKLIGLTKKKAKFHVAIERNESAVELQFLTGEFEHCFSLPFPKEVSDADFDKAIKGNIELFGKLFNEWIGDRGRDFKNTLPVMACVYKVYLDRLDRELREDEVIYLKNECYEDITYH